MNPKRDSAVKRILAQIHDSIGWWGYRPCDLGLLIFDAVYKADKYDVLSKLPKGAKSLTKSFIRGDIRKEKVKVVELLIILIIILWQ